MKPYNDLNERITRNIIKDSNNIIDHVLEYELYDIHDDEDKKVLHEFTDWVVSQRNKVLYSAYMQGLLMFNDHGVTITIED